MFHTCGLLAGWSEEHRHALAPVIERYGEADVDEPERLHAAGLAKARNGEIGLLRDLQDLHVLATLVQTTWTVFAQGAQGLRDHEPLDVATSSSVQRNALAAGARPCVADVRCRSRIGRKYEM